MRRFILTLAAMGSAVAACGEGGRDTAPSSTVPATVTTAAPTTTTTAPLTYVLQAGDTPIAVAERFGLTLEQLEQFNFDDIDYARFWVGGEIHVSPPPTTLPPPTTAPAPTTTRPPTPGQVTMAFSGEILAHRAVNRGALQADGSYDYTSMLANIAPITSAADITVCHLEAPIAPPGAEVMVEPQKISSAASITTALARAGFDRCSTASNHSVDRGAAGVDATVAAFEAVGMRQSGVARTEAERLPELDTVNGVQVAHLAYSYGFDGTPLPAGEPWRANVTDPYRIVADARAARAAGADIVVLSLHWGNSKTQQPTTEQRRIAEAVTASGEIDLIVGHHAHVLQPISQVNGVWIVWGLGNFVSDHPTSDRWPPEAQDGVLVTVTFTRNANGTVSVATPVVQPTWCDKDNGWVVRSTAERDDPTLSISVREQLRRSHERTTALLGDFIVP